MAATTVAHDRPAHSEGQEDVRRPTEVQLELDAPPTSGAVSQPQQWAADPSSRNEWRFWDGVCWTDYVANAGMQSRDPIG